MTKYKVQLFPVCALEYHIEAETAEEACNIAAALYNEKPEEAAATTTDCFIGGSVWDTETDEDSVTLIWSARDGFYVDDDSDWADDADGATEEAEGPDDDEDDEDEYDWNSTVGGS